MKMFTMLSFLLFISIFTISSEGAVDTAPFIEYKSMEQVTSLATSSPTVLFFKANWCPSCRAASKDFEKNRDQLTGINLVVVDYDNSKNLQIKYGVTYQHTFVQVSTTGEALTKWNGGESAELLKNIVKVEM